MRSPLPRRQRGIALLVALLTVALAVILIAGLLDHGELAYARTRNALRGAQADSYAQGLEAYAALVLAKDWAQSRQFDANGDIWTLPLPPQQVPGGEIAATMRDLNGCFNLNNLGPTDAARTAWLAMFRRLLNVEGIDPGLADAVTDWLDTDQDITSNTGAEDDFYLALPAPYRTANRSFAHVSELRLVRGFDGEAYARLAPYLCALPVGSVLNINTASVPILESLDPHINQALAQRLWNNGHAQWQDLNTFSAQLTQQGLPPLDPALASQIGVSSNYFMARGQITLDDVPMTFYSLIQRNGGRIEVLERSRGSDEALTQAALQDADAENSALTR
ncbi:MAG: type II secretion system minor pseudopilin GspK [Rhodanobacteraceae bacterium]